MRKAGPDLICSSGRYGFVPFHLHYWKERVLDTEAIQKLWIRSDHTDGDSLIQEPLSLVDNNGTAFKGITDITTNAITYLDLIAVSFER